MDLDQLVASATTAVEGIVYGRRRYRKHRLGEFAIALRHDATQLLEDGTAAAHAVNADLLETLAARRTEVANLEQIASNLRGELTAARRELATAHEALAAAANGGISEYHRGYQDGATAEQAAHVCEPLPQRRKGATVASEAAARGITRLAPEWSDAAREPASGTPAPAAKPRSATGSRPGRTESAEGAKPRTRGGSKAPKPSEAVTAPREGETA